MEGLLQDLGSVAQEAAKELGRGATSDEVAAHAVKVGPMKAIVATKLTPPPFTVAPKKTTTIFSIPRELK